MVDKNSDPTDELSEYEDAARAQHAAAMAALPKRERGLYDKYIVSRADGDDLPGCKHSNCEYFVLDLTHDPIARMAYATYALRARVRGYKKLADDMRATLHRLTLSHPLDGRINPREDHS